MTPDTRDGSAHWWRITQPLRSRRATSAASNSCESFPDERTLTRDLLWYCDMTVGPRGDPLSFTERMNDVRSRYGADDYVTQALDASMPERIGAVIRAETWIESVGLAGQV